MYTDFIKSCSFLYHIAQASVDFVSMAKAQGPIGRVGAASERKHNTASVGELVFVLHDGNIVKLWDSVRKKRGRA